MSLSGMPRAQWWWGGVGAWPGRGGVAMEAMDMPLWEDEASVQSDLTEVQVRQDPHDALHD